MTKSPWTFEQTGNTQSNEERPETSGDKLATINALMHLSVWGNSQVNAYLFNVIDDHPDVNSNRILFASSTFRSVHHIAMDATQHIALGKEPIEQSISRFIIGTNNQTPMDNFLEETISKIQSLDKSNQALFTTQIYGYLMHLAARIFETHPLPNGYIHHSMVSMLGEKVDSGIAKISKGVLITESLEEVETANKVNFIQSGHQLLRQYLYSSLDTLVTIVKKTNPSAIEDFETTKTDAQVGYDFLNTLYDGVNELIASHEWPEIYEKIALENLQAAHCTSEPIPVTTNCGIQRFVSDVITYNAHLQIHPRDAQIMRTILDNIFKQHPLKKPHASESFTAR